jgi:hypothetical protein
MKTVINQSINQTIFDINNTINLDINSTYTQQYSCDMTAFLYYLIIICSCIAFISTFLITIIFCYKINYNFLKEKKLRQNRIELVKIFKEKESEIKNLQEENKTLLKEENKKNIEVLKQYLEESKVEIDEEKHDDRFIDSEKGLETYYLESLKDNFIKHDYTYQNFEKELENEKENRKKELMIKLQQKRSEII